MEKRKVESNIWKLYIIKAVGSFMLIMPVITLFFKENGLSMQDIFVLQALFSLSVMLLEVPSGYFSDRVGRKRALIIGYLLSISGYIAYSLAYGFWEFVWAEMLLGFGISFSSGTDSALLYDSLLEEGKESGYTRLEGRRFSAGLISESLASVLGGFLALASLRLPLYCETALLILALPVVFSIVEPSVCMVKSKKSPMEEILDVLRNLVHRNNKIKWIILYSSLIGASTLTMVWMIQPYLEEVKIPIGFFGIIWAGLMLLSAVVSWNAEKISNVLGVKNILISMVILVAIGYFSLEYFWASWAVIFLGLFYVVRGIHGPIISAHINGQVSSDVRATILSIKNLFTRIVFSIVGPFVGWINDMFSLELAIFYSGGIFTFLGLGALFLVYRSRAV